MWPVGVRRSDKGGSQDWAADPTVGDLECVLAPGIGGKGRQIP